MLTHARDLIQRTAKLEQELASLKVAQVESVAFACQRSLAHTVLREPLAQFARERRDIRLSIRIAFQEEVLTSIRMGTTDVGCFLAMTEPLEGQSLLIGRQRCVLFATPDHPLVGRRIQPHELEGSDFVGPVGSSHFGTVQNQLLRSIGIEKMQVVAEGTEFSLIRDLVAAGLGIGCSLYESVRPEVENGRLAIIDLDAPPLLVNVYLITNTQRRSAKSVSAFVSFLQASFRKQAQ